MTNLHAGPHEYQENRDLFLRFRLQFAVFYCILHNLITTLLDDAQKFLYDALSAD